LEVEVEGLKGTRYVVAAELPLLEGDEPIPPAVTLLAPLDPLMWDRRQVRDLWDFEYLWEVYVPEAKRRWGYYVLPILFGDSLVGRIEPRVDRTTGTLRIIGLWWEKGFAPRRADGLVPAMRDALRAYMDFTRTSRVDWAPATRGAKRLFGSLARAG
jgi:uncharacterized protein